jgi:hypothetical protein
MADAIAAQPGRAGATEAGLLETAEGELASLASARLDGREGVQTDLTVGVVFGEDWCFVVEATTSDPASFADLREAARTVTQTTFLGLGERRRRRYLYRVPAGWTEERRPRAMHYRPPGHPDVRGLIMIDDAMPRGLSLDEEVERTYVLGGYEPRASDEPATAVRVAGGALTGMIRWYRVSSGSGVVISARSELGDDRFLYRQHMFGSAEHERLLVDAFLELLYSVEPLPRPWKRGVAASALYAD